MLGRDLADFSLDTVQMFYDDARAASFSLPCIADAPLRRG
jgi:hypothetical protein